MKESDRLLKQLETLTQIAEEYFSEERYKKVEKLIEHFGPRMMNSPASGKVHFHCCYPGGWLDHTLNVVEAVKRVANTYKSLGGDIDFTAEEAIFCAMFHDLGKLGDVDTPYYIEQTSDWHRNRGELYIDNPALPNMPHSDRSLYLLQEFGIEVNQKEWRTIKCHDGLFIDSNKPYFISYGYPPPEFFTNLHHIVHWADMMATYMEHDKHRKRFHKS